MKKSIFLLTVIPFMLTSCFSGLFDDEEEEAAAESMPAVAEKESEKAPNHLPTAADRLKRLNEISAKLDEEEENNGPV